MKKSKFTEAQIAFAIKQSESGVFEQYVRMKPILLDRQTIHLAERGEVYFKIPSHL